MKFSRKKLHDFFESPKGHYLIFGLIFINACILTLQTVPAIAHRHHDLLHQGETWMAVVFVGEVGMRWFVGGKRFFSSGWNISDFCIVIFAVSLHMEGLAALRAFRVVKVLTTFELMPGTRKIVHALEHMLPSILHVVALFGLAFFIFTIMAVDLFGQRFPDTFGTLGEAALSLTLLVPLVDFERVAWPVISTVPYGWVFFVTFFVIMTFIILNLFTAVVVSTMMHGIEGSSENELDQEMKMLQQELKELKFLLKQIPIDTKR